MTSVATGWAAGYARLLIDRPERGLLRVRLPRAAVMDAALHREVARLWRDVAADGSVRAVLLAGVTFSGAEAEAMGMVSLAVPDEEVDAHGLRIAARLTAGPPQALRATKRAINQWVRQAAPVFEASLAAEVLGAAGPEGREGFDAFAEHRAAGW